MKSLSQLEFYQEHNRHQQEYFSQTTKPTMIPTDSLYLRRQVAEMLRVANLVTGERVLEVGCGMGRYTFLLAHTGIQIEGMDLTPALLDKLRATDGGRYNIPLHCADVLEYPPDLKNRFDAVIGFFTLHHLHNIPACYRAMEQMVKPGGRIVFLEPNPYNPLYYLQILFTARMTFRGERGIFNMRKSFIFNAMQAAGLSKLEVVQFGFFPPVIVNHPDGAKLEAVLERVSFWRPLLPFQLFKGVKNG